MIAHQGAMIEALAEGILAHHRVTAEVVRVEIGERHKAVVEISQIAATRHRNLKKFAQKQVSG